MPRRDFMPKILRYEEGREEIPKVVEDGREFSK